MIRYFVSTFFIVAFLAVAGCEKQTSELVQSAARGDEAVVLSNLRSIMSAQQTYHVSTGNYGTFQQLTEEAYLNANFAREKPVISGYAYTMSVSGGGTSYACNADPVRTGERAGRHFYIESSSSDIHVNTTQTAAATDEVLKP